MLDIKYIRENPEKVKKAIVDRKSKPIDIEELLKLDNKYRKLIEESNILRAKRNTLDTNIKKSTENNERQKYIEESVSLKTTLKTVEEELKLIEHNRNELLIWLPNVPLDDVPFGKSEADNEEIKAWIPRKGYLDEQEIKKTKDFMPTKAINSSQDFEPVPHWDLGKRLDIFDFEAGSKVSGNRFYYLKNEAVIMMYAVFDLLFKKLINEEGFMPMTVPLLVRENSLFGTSHFPGDSDQVYKIDKWNVENSNDLYLIGSSEPSLFAYFGDKQLEKKDLPIKVCAISTCFRSEVGSWGKDVRGIKRTHQFDKLEMDMIVQGDLESSYKAQEYLLGINEWLLQTLKLPYHIINMCTADLGYYAAAKKYDFEVWLPTDGEFMEAGSDSITTDFQSRRLNIKYKEGDENKYVHTVNDTGVTHRILIAILDHYQQKDGSVSVPEVLRKYTGFDVIKPKK